MAFLLRKIRLIPNNKNNKMEISIQCKYMLSIESYDGMTRAIFEHIFTHPKLLNKKIT
jgi:hypothetical protein